MNIEIYTDGACSGNPGPGGWAAVMLCGDHRRELSGFVPYTTNNRMELTAVIEAIKALKRPSVLTLYSDSTYVVNAFEKGWLSTWQRSAWRKSDKKPVLNSDLWEELLVESLPHTIKYVYVRGHENCVENNRCDEMARQQIQKNSKPGETALPRRKQKPEPAPPPESPENTEGILD